MVRAQRSEPRSGYFSCAREGQSPLADWFVKTTHAALLPSSCVFINTLKKAVSAQRKLVPNIPLLHLLFALLLALVENPSLYDVYL